MSTKLTPYQAWLRSSLRQDYIAREMGMDPTQLNHLLRGRRPWNAAARAAFCSIVAIPESEIDFALPLLEQAALWAAEHGHGMATSEAASN